MLREALPITLSELDPVMPSQRNGAQQKEQGLLVLSCSSMAAHIMNLYGCLKCTGPVSSGRSIQAALINSNQTVSRSCRATAHIKEEKDLAL